ncbi:hypothetical protein FRUB_07575 [Fimbriiglobus ruber]|uniref:Uncharacterized protein n=1 Tax=Fimbriiglobus ruber TaxID=1908690 RepID=A0A225DPZ3_9BACT|nr:hypothetical protein FRUB_07575 [Fimbriiglobus ruber]
MDLVCAARAERYNGRLSVQRAGRLDVSRRGKPVPGNWDSVRRAPGARFI